MFMFVGFRRERRRGDRLGFPDSDIGDSVHSGWGVDKSAPIDVSRKSQAFSVSSASVVSTAISFFLAE